MVTRTATAEWLGDLQSGLGSVSVASGVLSAAPYSFPSRFESGRGTNPEELIGAAHAGCFSMAFAAALGRAGFRPARIVTKATVHLERDAAGFTITKIALYCEGQTPAISGAQFQEIAEEAKKGCPVSRALAGVAEISLTAKLV